MARRFRRKLFRRKRRYGRGVRKIRRIAKATVRSLAETKWVFRNYFVNFAGGTNNLDEITPSVSQGTGQDDRIGNKIRLKFLQINGVIYAAPGIVPPWYNFITLHIFWSRQALPTISSTVDDSSTPLSTFNSGNGKLIKSYRFLLSTGGQSSNAGLPIIKSIKLRRRLRQPVHYATDGNNLPASYNDRLYFLFMTSTGVTNVSFDVRLFVRWSFIDI